MLFDDAVPCGKSGWCHELVGAEANVSGCRLSSFSNLSANCWFDAWIWLRIESTDSLSWIGTRGCKSVGEEVVTVLTGCICWMNDPSCIRSTFRTFFVETLARADTVTLFLLVAVVFLGLVDILKD